VRRLKLLVVEDHAATAGGMKTYLDLMGYTVALAGSVAAGRELARTTEFDVLVCDIHLPDGTGWDLLMSLRQERPIRAVAFSAYDEPDYHTLSAAAGFLDYVVKGSPPELLVEAIERAATSVPAEGDGVVSPVNAAAQKVRRTSGGGSVSGRAAAGS
jgi:CheY-like chemotaxis protein